MTVAQTAKIVADALLGRTDAVKELCGEHFTVKTLEICTAMIPKATAEVLDREEVIASTPITKYFEYGWIIYTGSFDDEEAKELIERGHKELAALMRLAFDEGFRFLKLDCDACYLPPALGFPTFNW